MNMSTYTVNSRSSPGELDIFSLYGRVSRLEVTQQGFLVSARFGLGDKILITTMPTEYIILYHSTK